MDKYYLHPGSIFVSKKPHVVDTILGSCIAVCLWDPFLEFGGINHYMLPIRSGEGKPTCKYGDIAIHELIKRMVAMGSYKENLKAKIFGGSEIGSPNGVFNIGKRNLVIALDILKQEQIPVISFSVGGKLGRKVIFHSNTGEVFIRYIRNGKIDSKDVNSINRVNFTDK